MAGLEEVRAGLSMPGDDLQISVRFEGGCWLLDSRYSFETLAYSSGGAAEAAARTMAMRFAQSGQGVHITIEDRRHAVVGTRAYFPNRVAGSTDRVGKGGRT